MVGKRVDKSRLELFLQRLGAALQRPGVLFLVGGSALTWLGVKEFSTDIDVALAADAPDPEAMLDAILVAGDFVESQPDVIRMGEQVPLAEGAETRAQLVGEFGQATVYVFDLYSIALSKLARAAGKDVQDVKDMLGVGVITCRELRRHYESVAARFSKYVNRGDQAAFRRKVEGFLAEHCQ